MRKQRKKPAQANSRAEFQRIASALDEQQARLEEAIAVLELTAEVTSGRADPALKRTVCAIEAALHVLRAIHLDATVLSRHAT